MKTRLIIFFSVLALFNIRAQQNYRIRTYYGGRPGPTIKVTVQKPVELISGEIKPLIGLKTVCVKYDYESMSVCKFPSENEYLEDLRKKYKPKKAEQKIEEWKAMRARTLERRFVVAFNIHTETIGLVAYNEEHKNVPTLIVKVLRMDPHYHKENEAIPPLLFLECTFMDKDGNFIAQFNLKSSGSHEPNDEESLGEVFAIGGKMMAKDLVKRVATTE